MKSGEICNLCSNCHFHWPDDSSWYRASGLIQGCVYIFFVSAWSPLILWFLQGAGLELSENHHVKNVCQEEQFHGIGLFFLQSFTAENQNSALCENSKLQITTCSTQINFNFPMLDSINFNYKNELLII